MARLYDDRQRQDLIITTALLLGGEPAYYDYGHPERALSRKYWSITGNPPDAYGYTRWECALQWLQKKGYAFQKDGTLVSNTQLFGEDECSTPTTAPPDCFGTSK